MEACFFLRGMFFIASGFVQKVSTHSHRHSWTVKSHQLLVGLSLDDWWYAWWYPSVVATRAGARELIGGGGGYIRVMSSCPTNFFWNQLKNNWFQKKLVGQNTNSAGPGRKFKTVVAIHWYTQFLTDLKEAPYPFMSMSRNFSTRGISGATRVILCDLTLIWHCATGQNVVAHTREFSLDSRVEIEILIFEIRAFFSCFLR